MKKFRAAPKTFPAFMLPACVLLLAGCNESSSPEPEPQPEPEKGEIALVVETIAHNDALVKATPSPVTLRYVLAVDSAEGFDAQTVAATNRTLFAEAASREGISLDAYIEAHALSGTQSREAGPLAAASAFVAYAYGIDAEGYATTDVATCPFVTLAAGPGKPVDCIIDIVAVNLTDTSVDLTFAPTDESVYYYCTLTDEAGYCTMSADWNSYLYNYMAGRITENLTLEEVVKILCTRGRWNTRASELRPATTYYACAVGMDREALLITPVAVKVLTTPADYEHRFGFAASAEQIVWNGATVTVTPDDATAFYYWNTMTAAEYDVLKGDEAAIESWFEQKLDAQRRAELGDYADYYPLADYILDHCSEGTDSYAFTSLASATTYSVYAFWVDRKSGKKSSPTWFSAPFVTPARAIGTASVTATPYLTDGDDWAALDPVGYGHYAGKAILGARLQPSAAARHWYSNIYDAADLDAFTEEAFITALLKSGVADKAAYYRSYGVAWGGDYAILSVAVDEDGNAGELHRAVFTADPDAAEPLEGLPAQ